jgi:phospholipase/carboxylesterase
VPALSAASYEDAVIEVGSSGLRALSALEQVARHLQPAALGPIREAIAPLAAELHSALADLRAAERPEGTAGEIHDQIDLAFGKTDEALTLLTADTAPGQELMSMFGALRRATRAREALYPLRRILRPIGRYLVEPPFRDDLDALEAPRAVADDPDAPPRGLLLDEKSRADERGGVALYVPESYDPARSWPLVVALHGGMGLGRDFLWTWLREARGRGFLVLAPTSIGTTWSFNGPDHDAPAILDAVERTCEQWNVARDRILLTGLSDGATYTLYLGLREDVPFTALAPVSGVLHPANLSNGNLERARDRRIYLVHGALDWMFPVAIAQIARDALERAGADLVYREIPDLPHAYPREENDRILRWLDPGLSLGHSSGPPEGEER